MPRRRHTSILTLPQWGGIQTIERLIRAADLIDPAPPSPIEESGPQVQILPEVSPRPGSSLSPRFTGYLTHDFCHVIRHQSANCVEEIADLTGLRASSFKSVGGIWTSKPLFLSEPSFASHRTQSQRGCHALSSHTRNRPGASVHRES
jgi:hypothetical protein